MNNRVLVNIGQYVILNILYLISILISLGLLLVPATSTLFLFIKAIREQKHDPYSTIQSFVKTLIDRTKKLFKLSVVFVVIAIMAIDNMLNISFFTYGAFIQSTIYYISLFAVIEIILNTIIIGFLDTHYKFNKVNDILKMSFYIIHRHIIQTLILIIALVLISYLVIGVSWLFLFLSTFSLLTYIVIVIYQPTCNKYIIRKEKGDTNVSN